MTNVQATFAATLVDEWVRCGVQHAVLSPGSRSTPLALALAADDRVRLHVHHDERAASFMAVGVGKVSGVPAVLLTTSGTAAAELHAAVVEAHQARVPMLVCTADRPPELQSVGAPQTIDQTHLFGRSVRWFVEPGVADDATRSTWRSLAARAFVEATGTAPGPVHLNLAFRDPLVGEPGELPPGRPEGRPWHERGPVVLAHPERISGRRGLIVAGAGCSHLGSLDVWPVLADPLSGVPGVRAFDALLRTGRMPEPDAVLRVGDPPASKVLAQWLASLDCPQHVVASSWSDPDRVASTYSHTYSMVDSERDEEWWALWHDADAAAQLAIEEVLASKDVVTEPFVARTVSQVASTLVVSSSMPIRDVEWFGAPGVGRRILANRGANGIDGVVSTAVGVALGADEAVTVLVGDVAFLHDANALLGLRSRGVDVTIVVIDNRGGGIFSFLPQAAALGTERFELLFGTPHDVDLEALVAAHGLPATTVTAPGALRSALEGPGPKVVVVPTERGANVAVHDELHAAVAAAIGR